jgi:hypothetical protein
MDVDNLHSRLGKRGSFDFRFVRSSKLREWRDKQVQQCLAADNPLEGLVSLSEKLFCKLPTAPEQEVHSAYDLRVRMSIDDPRISFEDLPASVRQYALTAVMSVLLSRRYELRYGASPVVGSTPLLRCDRSTRRIYPHQH